MRVEFAFGKTGLSLDLPAGFDYELLEAKSVQPLPDEEAALSEALDHPIGCKPLVELAAGRKSAAISVCDITRPVPNRRLLPPILERLERAGIGRDAITILIATGLHRGATDAEIREIVGDRIAAFYRVENHDARDFASHRFLGHTSNGTPAYVDNRFVSADLRLTIGFIEPHLMLGYSGSRKLVAPGLAAQETIKVLHGSRFMRDPLAVEGSIEDNPLHRELLEIAAMAGQEFSVDVSLTRDRRIAGVFAGQPREAHARGVAFVSRAMLQQLENPVDAVITTAAGYPLDLTFYQAIKGITAAQHVVKRGGPILLLAECSEGAGAHEFRSMLASHPNDEGFLKSLDGVPVTIDQWQLEKLAMVTTRHPVMFHVPGLPQEFHGSLWGSTHASPTDAAEALTENLTRGSRIAVIPEGPYVLARAAMA